MLNKVFPAVVLPVMAAVVVGMAQPAPAMTLRVCEDPNYLPYSNRAGEGFENKIAEAVAKDLGATLVYTWRSTRASGGWDQFIHDTLNAKKCDVVMDVPYASQQVLTTKPYYVSSYVFVFPRSKNYDIQSLDSQALRRLRIGYEADTPPEDGLKLRGIIFHAVPFDVGDTEGESPAVMLDAIQSGRIQVGITWEPAVGYFLKSGFPQMEVVPLPNSRSQGVPEQYIFPMSMGVRLDDKPLQALLNGVITKHAGQLTAILNQYGVKLVRPTGVPDY
jgi:mxaJ protein